MRLTTLLSPSGLTGHSAIQISQRASQCMCLSRQWTPMGPRKASSGRKFQCFCRMSGPTQPPSARLALGEAGVPYPEREWDSAIKSFCRLHRDTERTDPGAAPFNDGRGYWPTHLVVQVIPVDVENAAFDLYMECLNRIARGAWFCRTGPGKLSEERQHLRVPQWGCLLTRRATCRCGVHCFAA